MELIPVYLAFILALSIFLGFELIAKVPATLHTPLMSGANAISGITVVGALLAAGAGGPSWLATLLGALAVFFATVNVVGGYLVTNRMLGMFRRRPDSPPTPAAGSGPRRAAGVEPARGARQGASPLEEGQPPA